QYHTEEQKKYSNETHQSERERNIKPPFTRDGFFHREQQKAKSYSFIGADNPTATRAHVGRKSEQERTQQRSAQSKIAQLKKSEEQQPSYQSFEQMLEYQCMSNHLSRQPYNGLPDQVTRKIKETLAHADTERPRRKALAPNVI